MSAGERGVSLAVGLVLLSIVTLLGLAGASGAHVEQLLAQNESFRENAGFAASAGIEVAIRAIVNSTDPEAVVSRVTGQLPAAAGSYEADIRFMGIETGLPQAEGAPLAGAHFEIDSTGRAARSAVDLQRANVMWVVPAAAAAEAVPCTPVVARPCRQLHQLLRQSWQRMPAP
jgi:hypothetical protein